MQASPLSTYRPSRVAGGLLLWFALFELLSAGSISIVAIGLGFGLLFVEDSTKLSICRGVTLLWCVGSVLILLPGAAHAGVWWPAVQAALFSASVGFLMFEGLNESAVAAAALTGFGVLFF